MNVEWIASRLTTWFDKHARELPWRSERTAWGALVSEAMLQQTQLARVVEYWPRFMRQFPTPKKLAQSEESTALAAWEGLGYYRRVRHLRMAAAIIVREHSGVTPTARASLEALPGVGRYTAGAVASIVAGEPAPIVDANVARVFLRLAGVARAANDAESMRWCWSEAERYAKATSRPGVANEALMEFGGTICTPRSPRCGECPLRKQCVAFANGTTADIPVPKQKPARTRIYMSIALAQSSRGVLLEQRAADGLWGAMWQPPTVESAKRLARAGVAKAFGLVSDELCSREQFVFKTTHREVEFQVFDTTRAPSKFPKSLHVRSRKHVRWSELDSHALSSPMRALMRSLMKTLARESSA